MPHTGLAAGDITVSKITALIELAGQGGRQSKHYISLSAQTVIKGDEGKT